MSDIQNKAFKTRMKLLKLTNDLKYYFTDGVTVNVVTSSEYKNKIKDDLMLQKYLLDSGYKAKISAWEENDPADVNIIRSVWGYHKKVNEFLNFVNSANTINNKVLINDNIDKQKQFALLRLNDVQPVDTQFLNNINELHYKGGKLVVKPIVSASGDNTFIIENEQDLQKVAHLTNIMVQPFIDGISEGEISVIAINRVVKYGIKRHTGVFTEYKKPEFISRFDLDKEIQDIVRKILIIEEYKRAVIMRMDFVHTAQGYRVMEVELVDPDLFIETIPDPALKKEVYEDLVHSVERYLSKVEVEE